jgi:hypothetical protein
MLKDFATRRKIDFPLLADPDSEVIRSFKVFNPEATGRSRGMARPGFFYFDARGLIREKFFEANDLDRFTPSNVIGKLFPELVESVGQGVEAPHLRLTLAQSDRLAAPGNRFTLVAEVELTPGVHVYAPEVQGYKPIQLAIEALPEFTLEPVAYPRPKVLYLKAIRERLPVFEGKFRITQDATLSTSPEFVRSLGSEGKTITLGGELRYQACDRTVCYPPTSVPVEWQLKVFPLDRQRSPEGIQHR